MPSRPRARLFAACLASLPLAPVFLAAACGAQSGGNRAAAAADPPVPFAWPGTLAPVGEGYPKAGDPCRRLRDTPATAPFPDDGNMLVGCPGPQDGAAALAIVRSGGRVVRVAEGVTMIALPLLRPGEPAGAAPAAVAGPAAAGNSPTGDGPEFHAAAPVRCVGRAHQAPQDCNAGIARNRDGSAAVTVFLLEGRSRVISFDAGHRPTAAAAGPGETAAAGAFAARRDGALWVVTLGAERYEIPEALVAGR